MKVAAAAQQAADAPAASDLPGAAGVVVIDCKSAAVLLLGLSAYSAATSLRLKQLLVLFKSDPELPLQRLTAFALGTARRQAVRSADAPGEATDREPPVAGAAQFPAGVVPSLRIGLPLERS
jgi:hypothetical protein